MSLPPDQLVEIAERHAADRYPDERQELRDRLRRWITEVWLRHDTRPVGAQYAATCAFCKGTGKAHFCENVGCDKLSTPHFAKKELCFHPTPYEHTKYQDIQRDYIAVMEKVLGEIIEEQKANAWRFAPKSSSIN